MTPTFYPDKSTTIEKPRSAEYQFALYDDAVCALGAELSPSARQRGVAAELLRGHARARAAASAGPPDRALAPIERYVTWRARTDSCCEWESWTGLTFPVSGAYVFPHGLAPVDIDRDADLGTYWEPNVWMMHPDVQ